MTQKRFFYDSSEVDKIANRASIWGFFIGAGFVAATWAVMHYIR